MVKVDAGVKEYLYHEETDTVVVALLPNRTGACCNGASRKYYTPYVRPAKPDELFSEAFQKITCDGVSVRVTEETLEQVEGDLTIAIEKVFFVKKLIAKGLSPMILAPTPPDYRPWLIQKY